MTHRQRECLDFIRAYQARHGGVSPSFAELREALGLSSKSGVHRLLAQLEAQGLIARPVGRARIINLIDDIDLAHVPLARLVAELERRSRQVVRSLDHAGSFIPEEQRNHG